jgi:Transposase IS66 family
LQSDVASLLKQAKGYLRLRYEDLKIAVRKDTVIYADETGWLVNAQKAWMWIMASDEITVYVAAESRGKGIAEDLYGASQARCMHDGSEVMTGNPQKQAM